MNPACSPHSDPTPCDCEFATQRIIDGITQNSSGGSSSAPSPPTRHSSLSDVLKTAHALVQHWEDMNGCPNAAAHMDPLTLCSITDAISIILCHHEVAVRSISRGRRHDVSDDVSPGSQGFVTRVPVASIGELELEPLEQTIVGQEAVKHSILRLATVLQDIEEEAAWVTENQIESALRDRGVEELTTRLFRLLRTVKQMVTTGD
ncbi:hypothetical protein F5Y03DRAFT_128937 [Xylaria venustula]|nr:hypothetical protein F5Y03DRAFT_128937 [Xylaria venustula]